jgi:hypothetical protein
MPTRFGAGRGRMRPNKHQISASVQRAFIPCESPGEVARQHPTLITGTGAGRGGAGCDHASARFQRAFIQPECESPGPSAAQWTKRRAAPIGAHCQPVLRKAVQASLPLCPDDHTASHCARAARLHAAALGMHVCVRAGPPAPALPATSRRWRRPGPGPQCVEGTAMGGSSMVGATGNVAGWPPQCPHSSPH